MRQREDNAISIIEHEPDEIESRLGDLDVLETREQNEEI